MNLNRLDFRRVHVGLACTLALLAFACQSHTAGHVGGCCDLTRPLSETAVAPALEPLPAGAIQPRGWLRDWAVAARDGIVGQLDNDHVVFGDGWKAIEINATGAGPEGTGWPLEQAAYWLDGALRLGLILDDQALIEKVGARLDPVVENTIRSQSTLIWWKDRDFVDNEKTKRGDFNNWSHSHLARALLVYYQATGDAMVLEALRIAYRDFAMPAVLGHYRTTYGITNLEPMFEVYRLTGDETIRDAALAFVNSESFREACGEAGWAADQRDYGSGHAVLFAEYIRVPLIGYLLTGDESLRRSALDSYQWAERTHLLPHGVLSGEEYMSGIGSLRCTETCDIPAWMHAQSWRLRVLGDARAADMIERAFFNAGPAPIARDWETMSYYQTINRIGPDAPGANPHNPHGGREGETNFHFSKLGYSNVLCCVANSSRIIPGYVMDMWQQTADGGLAATLYGPNSVTATAGGVPVRIESETHYPFEERILMRVQPERAASFPLYIRVPAWCEAPRLSVNGELITPQVDAQGFIRVEQRWQRGSIVELEFPMTPRVEFGRETPYPQVAYFRRAGSKEATVNNPFAAVHYGPLLFALPIPDINPDMPAEGADWRFALDVDGRAPADAITVTRTAMPDHWQWQLAAPLVLTAPARRIDWEPSEASPLPSAPVAAGEAATVELIPYGCAKFRVAMFPVTERAWAARD